MFSGREIFLAGKSLVNGVLCCSLLTGSLLLAGPRETNESSASQAVRNTIASASESRNRIANNRNGTSVASLIRNVSVNKVMGGALAIIDLDGEAKFNHFTLPSPYRVVIDIQNVTNATPPVIEVGQYGIKRVRMGKMDDAVRIVFDAEKQQRYQISGEGTQIRIAFGDAQLASTQTPPPPVNAPSSTAALNPVITTQNVAAARTVKANPAPVTVAPSVTENAKSKTVAPNTKPVAEAPAPTKLESTPAPTPIKPSLAVLPNIKTVQPKVYKPGTVALSLRSQIAITTLPVNYKDMPPPLRRRQAMAEAATIKPTPKPIAKSDVVKATPTPVVAPTPTVKSNDNSTPKNEVAKTTSPAPANDKVGKAPVVTPTPAAVVTATAPPRPREIPQTIKPFNASDYMRPDFVGEPINLDLRSTANKIVDIRDFLRFISDTYKVNFVLDQSVKDTPITVTLQGVPWNQAMEALLRANRLGVKAEGNILRVLSLETIAQEDRIKQEQIKARQEATPLATDWVKLKYARAMSGGGGGSSAGGSSSSSSPASSGGSNSGAGSTASGSGIDGIIKSRLSPRGSIQADPRTNTLILIDLPENIAAIKEIIKVLDVPEPQVEIESRIVIANRNFARDLGVQLGAIAVNNSTGGSTQVATGPNLPGAAAAGGTNSVFPALADTMKAAGALFGLGLTTGRIGSAQISAVLTAAESKGNVKTISSPRITAQNNQTANIVNGVQIPVQTESNNTLTVTFVTAALRLEITPQINDAGFVNLKVVAENNSVNTAIATSAAPGINTQRAETTVLVPDGGTTIIGGINIDVERNTQQRTPGISGIPGLGELFKRRTVSRQTDEILFFITPRIYRPMDVTIPPQK